MDMSRVKEDEHRKCMRGFSVLIARCWQDEAGRTEVRVKYTHSVSFLGLWGVDRLPHRLVI